MSALRLAPFLFLAALGTVAACTESPSPTSPTPVGGLAAIDAAPPKTAVCHRSDSEGSFVLISIADPALPAHLAHGDATPGDPVPGSPGFVFDEACAVAPAQATTFVGTFVGDGTGGTIDLTLVEGPAAAAVVASGLSAQAVRSVTGVLRFVGGGLVRLEGTWDSETGIVSVSGGGYTFVGTLSGSPHALTGSFTGPSSGSFSTLPSDPANPVTTYCGTAAGDNTVGLWMMQVSSTGVATVVGEDEAESTTFMGTGTATSTSVFLTGTVGWNGTASGTITGGMVAGTWQGDGETGTWQGSNSGCL